MCHCGSLPDHDECSRCALPLEEKEGFDAPGWNLPPLPVSDTAAASGYADEDPF